MGFWAWGGLVVVVRCSALLCMPVLSAFAVLLYMSATLHVPLVRRMAHLFLYLGWIALLQCHGHCRSAIALPVGHVACVWSLAGLCSAVLLLADPLYPVGYVGTLLWTVPC